MRSIRGHRRAFRGRQAKVVNVVFANSAADHCSPETVAEQHTDVCTVIHARIYAGVFLAIMQMPVEC